MRSVPMLVSVGFALMMLLFLSGCCGHECRIAQNVAAHGGGQDTVTVDLPFAEGFTSQCVQGVGGSYSHAFDSTYYDVDLDTPNAADEIVYAPVDGFAFVHDGDRESGFGVHVNIDVGDGTYVLLGHLDEVFIDDASEVAAGQLIGFEGTTGASTGDHVHFGRHDGDASRDASYGESIEGLTITLDDLSAGDRGLTLLTSEMTCDLASGHRYGSRLATPLWHPNGSLVKTPDSPDVYLLQDDALRLFEDEDVFWGLGYDFAEVALIDNGELACYSVGTAFESGASVTAVYDDGVAWLLQEDGGNTVAQRVRQTGWQAVLKSWGIAASTYDDVPNGSIDGLTIMGGYAPFRDGTLVSEVSSSAVYVVGDDIAMPIETWETYLLLGFGGRTVLEVDDGLVNTVMDRVGDCAMDAYCISREDVTTCGGPSGTEASYDDTESDSEEEPEGVEAEDTDVPEDVGGGSDEDSLTLSWTTPSGSRADRITLSGEYTSSSGSSGWQELYEVTNASTITYVRDGVAQGDNLRFSVEFADNGGTSWSCLAPFPPGTVQGSMSATWGMTAVSIVPTADPSSAGCGLTVQIPSY